MTQILNNQAKNNYGKNINKNKQNINNKSDNKIESLLSFNNYNNKKNIINNIVYNNYMKTNANSENDNINSKPLNNFNSDIKNNILINKQYEKSCPKFNINRNITLSQIENNSNIKNNNYNRDNNDLNVYLKKPSIDILKSIIGNLIPYYNSIEQKTSINISNNKNGNSQKSIQFNNDKIKIINNSKVGNLQNIIMKNDDNINDNYNNKKVRISIKTSNYNKKNNI